jgi:hypothetical protein
MGIIMSTSLLWESVFKLEQTFNKPHTFETTIIDDYQHAQQKRIFQRCHSPLRFPLSRL